MDISRFSDLKPCRDLIDPNFGGYKLSLDALPTYSLNLNDGNASSASTLLPTPVIPHADYRIFEAVLCLCLSLCLFGLSVTQK